MRRIPFYTVIQEAIMQVMMIVMIVAYICYDYMDEIGFPAYIIIGVAVIVLILVMRKQMTNMIVVQYLAKIPVTKSKTVSRNWVYPILSNVFIIGLTGLHFWLYFSNQQDLIPLYKEYGFGALLAFAMISFNYFKWECHLTDKGLAIGSKLEQKLISWKEIKGFEIRTDDIFLTFEKSFPILKMNIKRSSETVDLEKLLTIEVV